MNRSTLSPGQAPGAEIPHQQAICDVIPNGDGGTLSMSPNKTQQERWEDRKAMPKWTLHWYPLAGTLIPMATQRKQRNDRVQVPRDPALDRAIKRGRAALGPSTPTSKVVRELALRGAEAFEGDEAAQKGAVDFALSVADGTSGLDLDRLRSARERAWGR